jgi:hypothetical protein
MDDATVIGAVRAKMICNTIEARRWGQLDSQVSHKVEFGVVGGTDGENKVFCDATPGGHCWLTISQGRPAATFFKPGKRYYVTFAEAPE